MEKIKKAEKFHELLRIARENRGMSQTDLAKAMGAGSSLISHFESGRRKPSLDNLRELSKALGVSANYLLGLGTTESAFLGEQKLSAKERAFVQTVIDSMLANDPNRIRELARS